jgi:DNA-binding transcriptional LysR family regulator
MTPARLQTFVAVVDLGTARAAAQHLHVTESAVSASLASLQRELGVALFERRGRRLHVTEAGEIFATYARTILGLLDEGVQAARHGTTTNVGRVRLGAVTTAGEYLVPGLLASFREHFPDIEINLEVGVRDTMLARLADHHLDVAIAGRPLAGRGIVARATRDNSLVIVAAPGHPPELASATWLLREPGSGTRATTLALIKDLGINPPTLSLGSHGAVIASASLGLGVTVASTDAVARQVAAGELEHRSAPGTPLRRPWHLLTTGTPTAATRLFIQHVTSDNAGTLAFRARSARRRTPSPSAT